MEYNADELVSPDWLDKNYLEKVISQYENDTTVKVNYIIMKKIFNVTKIENLHRNFSLTGCQL